MKLIISLQDGRVNMISVSMIEKITFGDTGITVYMFPEDHGGVCSRDTQIIHYRDIRSIVIA